MSDVIFCKTRYQDIGYHSYNDLWRLVELAGYPIIYVDELDAQSDNTYIVTPLNDEWLTGWQAPRARIIHLEMEWRIDWRADVNTPPGVAETWACDAAYAKRIGAKYVPMGSDERLNEVGAEFPVTSVFDASLLSYQTPRRQIITEQLLTNGLNLAPFDNLWGRKRSAILRQSRLMLHIHQTEQTAGVAPLRWCLAAAHHLPLITETVPDRGIFGYSYMMQSSYEYLARFTAQVVKDHYMLEDYANALHSLLCRDWTFRKCIEANV